MADNGGTKEPVEKTEKENAFEFTDVTYSTKFLGDLCQLMQGGEFSDVKVCSGGLQIPCHKVILSAASPFFRAMFTSGKSYFLFSKVHNGPHSLNFATDPVKM